MLASSSDGPPPADVMFRMITGYWVSQLRAAASVGVLQLSPDDRFSLTPLGETLRSCPSRIRRQTATESWTMSPQWATQRTLFNSARGTACTSTHIPIAIAG